jgi:hypothetical protein
MKTVMFLSLALFSSTVAHAAPAGSFRQSGYNIDMQRQGEMLVLTGYNPKNKAKFNLTVDPANHVTGVWNGQPIEFTVGEKSRAKAAEVTGQ